MLECGVYYNNKTYKAGRSCIYRQDCRKMIWKKRHLTPEGIEAVKRIKDETEYSSVDRVRALRDVFDEETVEGNEINRRSIGII